MHAYQDSPLFIRFNFLYFSFQYLSLRLYNSTSQIKKKLYNILNQLDNGNSFRVSLKMTEKISETNLEIKQLKYVNSSIIILVL